MLVVGAGRVEGRGWEQRCQMFLLFLPDRNLAIRSVTVCVCRGVQGQHISVCVFTLSHSCTSLLSVPLFCFCLAGRVGADRLIEGRLKHGQTLTTAKLGLALVFLFFFE